VWSNLFLVVFSSILTRTNLVRLVAVVRGRYLEQRLGKATMTAIYQLVDAAVGEDGILVVDDSLEDILGNDAELLDLVYRLVAFDRFGGTR